MKKVKNKVVMVGESGDEDIVIPDSGDQEQGGEVLHHLMTPVTKVDDYWLWKSIFKRNVPPVKSFDYPDWQR